MTELLQQIWGVPIVISIGLVLLYGIYLCCIGVSGFLYSLIKYYLNYSKRLLEEGKVPELGFEFIPYTDVLKKGGDWLWKEYIEGTGPLIVLILIFWPIALTIGIFYGLHKGLIFLIASITS